MKKIIALPIFLLLLQGCAVKLQPHEMVELGKDSSGRFYYEEITPVNSLSGKEIYNRALIWMARNYKSANDVIQIKDDTNLMIIGRGGSTVYDPFGNPHSTSHMIKIEAKDQRYRVRFYDLYIYDKPMETLESIYLTYLDQERALIKNRVESLKRTMMESAEKTNDW